MKQGSCSDFIFSFQCSQDGCETLEGACFRAHQKGVTEDCNYNQNEMAVGNLGCKLLSYNSKSACESASSLNRWVPASTNASSCAAQLGKGCLEPNSKTISIKDAEECTKCNGTLQPFFEWKPAKWIPGKLQALTTFATNWTSVNKFKRTLNNGLLRNELTRLIGSLQLRQYSNYVRKKYTAILGFYDTFSCACGADENTMDCFGNVTFANLASCRADPGLAAFCEGISLKNGKVNS